MKMPRLHRQLTIGDAPAGKRWGSQLALMVSINRWGPQGRRARVGDAGATTASSSPRVMRGHWCFLLKAARTDERASSPQDPLTLFDPPPIPCQMARLASVAWSTQEYPSSKDRCHTTFFAQRPSEASFSAYQVCLVTCGISGVSGQSALVQ